MTDTDFLIIIAVAAVLWIVCLIGIYRMAR
jgi:hypothetical protein